VVLPSALTLPLLLLLLLPRVPHCAGARCCSLAPSSTWQDSPRAQPQLPPITFVFAEVSGKAQLARDRLRVLNKSIRRCMLKLQQELPGHDGYVCRCQAAELKFIVAFESPVHALQWCLLLQVSAVLWFACLGQVQPFKPRLACSWLTTRVLPGRCLHAAP
jgi:hypothetical protein